MRTFKNYPLSNFQVCNTVLLVLTGTWRRQITSVPLSRMKWRQWMGGGYLCVEILSWIRWVRKPVHGPLLFPQLLGWLYSRSLCTLQGKPLQWGRTTACWLGQASGLAWRKRRHRMRNILGRKKCNPESYMSLPNQPWYFPTHPPPPC